VISPEDIETICEVVFYFSWIMPLIIFAKLIHKPFQSTNKLMAHMNAPH
jgi:hypothetical protein